MDKVGKDGRKSVFIRSEIHAQLMKIVLLEKLAACEGRENDPRSLQDLVDMVLLEWLEGRELEREETAQ